MKTDSALKMKIHHRGEHSSPSSTTQRSQVTMKTERTKRKASPEQETPNMTKKRKLNEGASSSVDADREISSTRSSKRQAADDGEGPSRKRKRSPDLKETQEMTNQTAKKKTKHSPKQTTEHLTERTTEHLIKQTAEHSTERTTEHLIKQTAEHSTERTTEHLIKQTAEHSTEQTTEHLIKQTAEHSTEQTTEHLIKQMAEQTTEHLIKQMAEHSTEQTTEHLIKQTAEHSTEQTTEHLIKQTAEHSTEQTTEHLIKQTAKHLIKQTAEHSTEQTTEHLIKQTAKHLIKQTAEHSTEQTTEHLIKQTAEHSTEQTTKHSTKQMTEHSTQQMTEHSVEQTTGHSTRQTTQQNVTVLSPRAEFEAKYKERDQLGAGGCGCVFAGYRKADNLPVAIKRIHKDSVPCKHEDDSGNQVSVEVAIMEKLAAGTSGSVGTSAPVSLLDWYDLDQELILVMERPVPCVDLFDYVQAKGGSLQEEEAKIILKQLVSAAKELEDQQIFHRDIKIENILIETGSGFPRVRVIDFGLSCFAERNSSFQDFYGTFALTPPEWFSHHKYWAGPTTVWQVGAVLFDVLDQKAEFDTIRFLSNQLKIGQSLSKNCQDFLETCLTVAPEQRPTLEQLQQHPWLR